MADKIHECPADGTGTTPCCHRTPFQLPRDDRITTQPDLVTCKEVDMQKETIMAEKTKKMIMVEQQWNERLETLLPKMVTARGLTRTADQLGVSKATLGYWLLKLRINVKRVALAPGDTLTLERHGKPKEDVQ